ncbi:hypothetical protein [Thioalkalivibrio sp. ALMg13-2]|uniref:hypothetical protein n=1 Tax=Thioalkalivibrio sp. ALMg13-2 TaxID=1158167 RepID=UPI000364A5D2|nr:hypothetical protein [Thioalkalivibrio sp. ALMg13-2]
MNELAIAVVVILFPGLIAAVICDKITVHSPRWGSFKYSVYSFVLGVSSYVALQGIVYIWNWFSGLFVPTVSFVSKTLDVWTIVTTQTVSIDPSEVFWATILSPVIAVLAAFTVNHKIIHKAAQRLRVSGKYGDENLFSFFLNAQDINWVYVRDIPSKLTYQGRVVSFSEADDMQELVLSEVTVFAYETSDEYYSVPLLYLSKERGSFIIEAIPQQLLEAEDEKEAH